MSVISDLVTDQRVHKVCTTLHNQGYDVLLIGRKKKESLELGSRDYKTRRIGIKFQSGPLLYANFNLKLFFLLLFTKADILHANDLDTLLPNYLVAKLRRLPLVYDTHEFFTGVPELAKRPVIRKIWSSLESWIFPGIKYVFTVNESIARLYSQKYGNEVIPMRNVPFFVAELSLEKPMEFDIKEKILLYQGAGINIQRGVEELVESMLYVEGAILFILGGGDALEQIKDKVKALALIHKVLFIGKVPFKELRKYTKHAHLGFSIDKDTNINYHFSLPNKLFDFIHEGVPVLASRLPEVEKIVKEYQVGGFIESHDPRHIASCIQHMIEDEEKLKFYRKNALEAAPQLCWQKEEEKLISVYKKLEQ